MRMLLKATMDTPMANQALQEGTMQQRLQEAMERLQPEASYFYAEDGKRAALFIFEMEDPSQIPPSGGAFLPRGGSEHPPNARNEWRGPGKGPPGCVRLGAVGSPPRAASHGQLTPRGVEITWPAPGQVEPLAELVEVPNERYGGELGDADALRVLSDVRNRVREGERGDGRAGGGQLARGLRSPPRCAVDPAMEVGDGARSRGMLLKALLDDEEFRARAGELVMGSTYEAYRAEDARRSRK